jgi:predicted phage baseplate assembly protein
VFMARYRVGVARAGNVGVDAIAHIVDGPVGIVRVGNPIPAFGFELPETLEEVRRYAPQAFRTQERAVTADDYARAAERHPDVQRAAARIRWTGSWYTVFVSIDRNGGRPVDQGFALEMRQHLNLFRMAGFDLEIRPPTFVPLDIRLQVCVLPGYERSAVKRELLDIFSNRQLPDGRVGFFHPNEWTFGQPVYLSHVYERAMTVAGVDAVSIDTFKRWAHAAATEIADGVVLIGDQEIARLDNDPSLRENGLIDFVMEGGL